MNTKTIKKFQEKKYRADTGLFIVEGETNLQELLKSDFEIDRLYCTEDFAKKFKVMLRDVYTTIVQRAELESFGTFNANDAGLAVVKQKRTPFSADTFLDTLKASPKKKIVMVLDDINDPGNFGTLIRIADWYGITDIIASPNTTDFYNPKAISATRGSFTRINVHYTPLEPFLKKAQQKSIPVVGTLLQGVDIHTVKIPESLLVILGSESHGINKLLNFYISHKVTIPRFGKAESLNVGVAAGIALDILKSQK